MLFGSMASLDFTYCKLGNLNDLNLKLTKLKISEIESYKDSIFEACLKNKERILSRYAESKKEFLLRVKLVEEISELSQQHTIVSLKHSQLLKKLQSYREERESKDKKKELKKVSLYENNLGLRIEPASNLNVSEDETAVLFMFKNINENKPEEVCSFNLVITDNGMYKAVDCRPNITELNELILRLNNTNDLHNFIINIRKKFCEYLSKQI